MSVRETVTKMNLTTLISADIAANGVTNGAVVNGADNELGLSFFLSIRGTYTDGTYTLTLEDSADDGSGAPLGDWTAIPANQIVHGGSDDPAAGGVTGDNFVALAIGTGPGVNAGKLGVFSERRWVRPVITASAVTVGAVGVNVDVVKSSEYLAS